MKLKCVLFNKPTDTVGGGGTLCTNVNMGINSWVANLHIFTEFQIFCYGILMDCKIVCKLFIFAEHKFLQKPPKKPKNGIWSVIVTGADPGFSFWGVQKIMCAHALHEREARSPFRPGSRALEALGVLTLSHASWALFFKHSDTKWEKIII